jgi:DNA-binding NtrC family response regulator
MLPPSSRTLLVVDDEALLCNALGRTLRREGYRVLTATHPEQGLQVLRSTPVDLVLSDHLMPQMTGLEFLARVRDRHPDCVRVMLTGHADMEVAIEAINRGDIFRFLTKPWDDTELKVVLHCALEQLDLQREHRRLLSQVRLGLYGLDARLWQPPEPVFPPVPGEGEELLLSLEVRVA